jgi:DNA-binding transcriptional MerR regulator
MKIGEVAQRSGLTVKTIRFYCDEGLIHPISRSEGGYRLFGDEVFAELALIRTLKAMDIPLQDVRQILESRRSGVCTCTTLQDTIRTKAGEIEQKIAALRDLQSELEDLLSRWQDCGGRKGSAT